MTDKWARSFHNAKYLAYHLKLIMEGRIPPPKYTNMARMMLLSKEPTPTPPINRIRPIQMYSPLRKAVESVVDYLDN